MKFKKCLCQLWKKLDLSTVLFFSWIVEHSFRVDFKSKRDSLVEVDGRNAHVVGSKRRIEHVLVDLSGIVALGAEQTTHENARIVEILKKKASHGLVFEYAALRFEHVNVRRVVEQNFDLLFGHVVRQRTPHALLFAVFHFFAQFRLAKIVLVLARRRYYALNKACLEQWHVDCGFLVFN